MTRRQKVAAAAGTATLTAACASTQASTSWRRPRPGAVALHKDGRAAYAATQIMTIESAPSRAAERGDHPGRPRQFGMTMTLSVIAERARTIHARRGRFNRACTRSIDIWAVAVGSSVTLSNRWGSQSGSPAPFHRRGRCRWTRSQLVIYGLVVLFGWRTCKRGVWRGCARRWSRRACAGSGWFDVADAVRVTLVVDGLVRRLGRAAD
jgi:hypothetical protein